MNNHEKMLRRLKYILENEKKTAVSDLFTLGLVSASYDFRNLATDLWYLSYRDSQRGYDPGECYCAEDPIRSILFRTIVLALFDLKSGRPCDLGAWKKDTAPMGILTCTAEAHLCAPDAAGFLLNLDEDYEEFAGVRPGTIRSFADLKNI